MSDKYIIRNCPSFYRDFCDNTDYYCCDETDCVLKQIVEKCKGVENIENVETLYDAAQSGMFLQANRILKLLDIQEVDMMKYIIKNKPNLCKFMNMPCDTDGCQDCVVIKIVERCKEANRTGRKAHLATDILNMLDVSTPNDVDKNES